MRQIVRRPIREWLSSIWSRWQSQIEMTEQKRTLMRIVWHFSHCCWHSVGSQCLHCSRLARADVWPMRLTPDDDDGVRKYGLAVYWCHRLGHRWNRSPTTNAQTSHGSSNRKDRDCPGGVDSLPTPFPAMAYHCPDNRQGDPSSPMALTLSIWAGCCILQGRKLYTEIGRGKR